MMDSGVRRRPDPDGAPMIRARGLVKRYGRVEAVRGVDLDVGVGEVVGFLGPNGAGKTTTIKMLVGLARPTSGVASIAGRDVVREPLRAKAALGYVPDEPALPARLTPREYLAVTGALYGLPRADVARRAAEMLRLFGLEGDEADRLIGGFSHGMKQRTALCGALVHGPRALFLDEPTVGLDPQGAREMKDTLRALARVGARRRGGARDDAHPRGRGATLRSRANHASWPHPRRRCRDRVARRAGPITGGRLPGHHGRSSQGVPRGDVGAGGGTMSAPVSGARAARILADAALLELRRSVTARPLAALVGALAATGGAVAIALAAHDGALGLARVAALRMHSEHATPALSPPMALSPATAAATLAALPTALCAVVMGMALASSVSLMMQALYAAPDLDRLLTLPVPPGAVVALKMGGVLARAYMLVGVVLLPALWGYGAAVATGPTRLAPYLVVAAMVAAAVPILPGGVAALAAIALAPLVPPRLARNAGAFVTLALVGALILASQAMSSTAGGTAGVAGAVRTVGVVTPIAGLTGGALRAAATDRWGELAGNGAAYLGLLAASWCAVACAAGRWYVAGRSVVADRGGAAGRRRVGALRVVGVLGRWLPLRTRALVWRDALVTLRDGDLAPILFMPIVLVAGMTMAALGGGGDDASRTLVPLEAALLLCAIVTFAVARNRGVAAEGSAYALLRAAPIAPSAIVRAKAFVAYLPFPILAPPYLAVMAVLGHRPLGVTLIELAGVLAGGVGLASVEASIHAALPGAAARGALPLGWLIRFAAPMAYATACFAAFATPSLALGAMGIPHQPGAAAIAGVAALALVSLGVAVAATAWAGRRLDSYDV